VNVLPVSRLVTTVDGDFLTRRWLVRRFMGRRQAASRSAAGCTLATKTRSARAYARWLNDSLTQLAEALLWGSPLAILGGAHTDGTLAAQEVRLHETRRCLAELRETARAHLLAAGPTPGYLGWTHAEHVDLLERSLRVVDQLLGGLERRDAGAAAEASRELSHLATVAADLHARVIEQAFPARPAYGGLAEGRA
jgi:hypothetical protein